MTSNVHPAITTAQTPRRATAAAFDDTPPGTTAAFGDAPPRVDAEYQLTPHERVRVLRRMPELLEVEATYEPGGQAPVAHRHPHQVERFAVLEGQLAVTIDGCQRILHAGESVTIGRGRSHSMVAAGDRAARVIWQTSPALTTERWWDGLDELVRAHGGTPPMPAVARLLREHDDVFTLALPRPVARLVVQLLALMPVRRG
ncbi:MAG: cupin domain-containing protein [Solirubrobacteraceae bacterium]|nr:cupin domain-containing protein [Solirubrobacteraceae bacterium]